jgi:hypothetical protein
VKLKDLKEMVTTASVGSNVLPQRWLTTILRRPNLSAKDMSFYTDINVKKGNKKWRKKNAR